VAVVKKPSDRTFIGQNTCFFLTEVNFWLRLNYGHENQNKEKMFIRLGIDELNQINFKIEISLT
jgi:hypothetical protein